MERICPTTTSLSFINQINETTDLMKKSIDAHKNDKVNNEVILTQSVAGEILGEDGKEQYIAKKESNFNCKTCDDIKAVVNGKASPINSIKAVTEHFISEDTIVLDEHPSNIYTILDKSLINCKRNIKNKGGFVSNHWQEISSAIVVLIVVIFFALVIELFTGVIKISIVDMSKEDKKNGLEKLDGEVF